MQSASEDKNRALDARSTVQGDASVKHLGSGTNADTHDVDVSAAAAVSTAVHPATTCCGVGVAIGTEFPTATVMQ